MAVLGWPASAGEWPRMQGQQYEQAAACARTHVLAQVIGAMMTAGLGDGADRHLAVGQPA